jgi:hypothetical protein
MVRRSSSQRGNPANITNTTTTTTTMSLLQDEEFVIYQLRTSYLSNIKDGVGERLINVNASVLNNPSFRASGWQPNASDIKRTYSPPIPTAVTAEYFQAPRATPLPKSAFDDDDEIAGVGSNDTVGLAQAKRRRRREMERDDSSLSEDSDEDLDTKSVLPLAYPPADRQNNPNHQV